MDVYESARAQLGEFITFEALRIFDPETMQVVQEKRQAGFPIRFPSLTPAQAQEHLRLCLSTGKPLLHFIHEKEHLCLLVETPFQQSGKIRLLALMTDMTDHVFLNAAGPNDEKGLVNELRRLHRQNITDRLTGLYNRRYIDQRLPSDILACMEKGCPLSVLFADLDYYKKVNDLYGHGGGDLVLREMAGILARSIRKGKDWVARYGGEEFLAFLNGCGNGKAREIAERIRVAVMRHTFHYRGQDIRITCSFGVVTIDDFSASPSPDEILDAVDRRLYQAKERGRNVVV